MVKFALASAGFGLLIAAVATDWRAALLMIAASWADNVLRGIIERERQA